MSTRLGEHLGHEGSDFTGLDGVEPAVDPAT